MTIFNAVSVNLLHLGPVSVSYEPKGIHTEALHVTEENIGKLSLEFEEELFYDRVGVPYFLFCAQRFDHGQVMKDGEPRKTVDPAELYVRLTDWIVPLRGELHVFRNKVFQCTFTITNDFAPDGRGSMRLPGAISGEDLLRAPILTPREVLSERERNFAPNDRVQVRKTGLTGKVVVVDVAMLDGGSGIEVLMDGTGEYRTYDPAVLEHLVEQPSILTHQKKYPDGSFEPNSGEVEGPTGTQILPPA
jgi:hypothetical protein